MSLANFQQVIETFTKAGWTHMPNDGTSSYLVFGRRAKNIGLEIAYDLEDGACCLCFADCKFGEWVESTDEVFEYASKLAETDLFGGWE